MIEIKDKSQCTGCTACANVCTHRFITMCFDDEGHSYPLVDTANCVNCGLCEKVCPMLHQDELPKIMILTNFLFMQFTIRMRLFETAVHLGGFLHFLLTML